MPDPQALDRNSGLVPATEWAGEVLQISTVEEHSNDRRGRPAGPGASAGDTRPFGARRLLTSQWRVPVVFSLLAAGAVLAAPVVASASPLPSPVTGHVYLDDNTAGSNTIAVFDLLGSSQVSANGGVGAVDPGLSPDGRFLYVNESQANSLGAFAVSGGNLTELPGSSTPLPAGATPAGIAVS